MVTRSVAQITPLSVCDNFHDISSRFQFECHSAVLRINGFDCSSLNQSPMHTQSPQSAGHNANNNNINQTISNFLSPPTIHLSTFNFSPNFVNHISNSFNCLTSSRDSSYHLATPLSSSARNGQISSSDSNLNNLQDNTKENVFNFSPMAQLPTQHQQHHHIQCRTSMKRHEQKNRLRLSASQTIFKNPTSPFKVRSSPLPFLNLSLDTPSTPSSPLTSVSVLFNLPKNTLIPVLHWLYSESLPHNLNEKQLESLLDVCANIAALNKLLGPCKKYLRLIKLRKFIIDIVLEMHDCLNRMVHMLNPYNIQKTPSSLYEIFKQCICEMSIGFVLFLQLSQIFSKDNFLNRFQRNEIIKFVKSRVPIMISQLHQMLHNIMVIIKSLQQDEREDLVVYLVPEVSHPDDNVKLSSFLNTIPYFSR